MQFNINTIAFTGFALMALASAAPLETHNKAPQQEGSGNVITARDISASIEERGMIGHAAASVEHKVENFFHPGQNNGAQNSAGTSTSTSTDMNSQNSQDPSGSAGAGGSAGGSAGVDGSSDASMDPNAATGS